MVADPNADPAIGERTVANSVLRHRDPAAASGGIVLLRDDSGQRPLDVPGERLLVGGAQRDELGVPEGGLVAPRARKLIVATAMLGAPART